MKKLIAIALIMTSMVGFCRGHHNYRPIHKPSIHHHHPSTHRMKHRSHIIRSSIVGTVIGSTVGTIISNTLVNRVWIPKQIIIIGYDTYNRPIYTTIPGHWEYR